MTRPALDRDELRRLYQAARRALDALDELEKVGGDDLLAGAWEAYEAIRRYAEATGALQPRDEVPS